MGNQARLKAPNRLANDSTKEGQSSQGIDRWNRVSFQEEQSGLCQGSW